MSEYYAIMVQFLNVDMPLGLWEKYNEGLVTIHGFKNVMMSKSFKSHTHRQSIPLSTILS